METVTVSPKFQVVIPRAVRKSLNVRPGQKVQVIPYDNRIELTHWARGQEIAERWRVGLHALYDQINGPTPLKAELQENKVLDVIRRHGPQSAAQVARYIRSLSTGDAESILTQLTRRGQLVSRETSRTVYYDLQGDEP